MRKIMHLFTIFVKDWKKYKFTDIDFSAIVQIDQDCSTL